MRGCRGRGGSQFAAETAMSIINDQPGISSVRSTGDGGGLLATLVRLWPYIWPTDRRDLKGRVIFATVLLFARQIRHHGGAVHLQMGDRCAGRPQHGAVRAGQLAGLGLGRADRLDGRLWRHAHRHGPSDPMARRHFRQSRDERGAAARDAHLRAYASCSRCGSISNARPAG